MRAAFWTFPYLPPFPVEVILALKGKFGTWTFREEACVSDEGQICLLDNSNSNKSKIEFLTIFETSGMNNLNLLCFLFTFFAFVYLSSFLAMPLWSPAGQSCLPFSFGLQTLLGSHKNKQTNKQLTLFINRIIDLSRSKLFEMHVYGYLH